MFIANTITSPNILSTTPTANGLTFSGLRLISGSGMRFCLMQNSTRQTIPTANITSANHQHENTLEIAYNMPISEMLIRTTDKTSSFGFVSFATLPTNKAPKTNNKIDKPPKT